jgi:FMN-dependent NADH-azoreductase
MTTILHLDASARVSRSLSRQLSRRFIEAWMARRPRDRVIHRDVGAKPPPAISEAWITAAFAPDAARSPDQRAVLALSDELIAELTAADIVVLGTPMYNYGMPSALKAWVDLVARIGHTFTFDLTRGDFPLEPVQNGKTLVVLSSRGEFGFCPGGVRAERNHLDPHLRTVAHYLGVAEIHTIAVEYQEFGDDRHAASIAQAEIDAVALAGRLAG